MNRLFRRYQVGRCACGYYRVKDVPLDKAIIDSTLKGFPYFQWMDEAIKSCIPKNNHLIVEADKYNKLMNSGQVEIEVVKE